MATPTVVTDETFNQEVLKSDTPTLVDFWAVWCGPCRMVAPVVDEIAREQAGKLKVMKLDVDENQNTAMAYGVMSIPTLISVQERPARGAHCRLSAQGRHGKEDPAASG